MTRALVPIHAGVLSALGMLAAPRVRHVSHTLRGMLMALEDSHIENELARLARQGREALQREGVAPEEMMVIPSVDLRYRGQSYAINLPWRGKQRSTEDFHARHEALYGHRLSQGLELVTLRVKVQRAGHALSLQASVSAEQAVAAGTVSLVGIKEPVPVYARDNLPAGHLVTGPALITETVSTTYLAPDWQASVHPSGTLLLSYQRNEN